MATRRLLQVLAVGGGGGVAAYSLLGSKKHAPPALMPGQFYARKNEGADNGKQAGRFWQILQVPFRARCCPVFFQNMEEVAATS